MKKPNHPGSSFQSCAAYSLVEAIIAGFLLVIAISAAAVLAHTITANEESNTAVARAINTQEQAARLYSLGMSPTQITNILPEVFTTSETPAVRTLNLSFTNIANTNIANVGTLETADSIIIFPVGQNIDSAAAMQYRANTNNLVRPSIR